MKKLLAMIFLMLLVLGCAAVCLAEAHTCSGGTATCEALAVCSTCGKPYGHLAGHSWGSWSSDGASTHTRVCTTNSAHKETRYHTGGASSCTQGAVCVYCKAVHDDPLGHVPSLYVGFAPTCTRNGATDGEICSRCGDVLTPRKVISATGHNYSEWTPTGDGTHTGICITSGCGTATAVLCTPFEVTADGAVATVCPICGSYGSEILPVLLTRQSDALSAGQLLVRGKAAPFGGALYAFTVAGSFRGEMQELNSPAKITIDGDFASLPFFSVVRVDVTGSQTAERTETQAPVDFSLDGSKLTITTDRSGLFLLVPVE